MNHGVGNITLGATRLGNTVANEEKGGKKKENENRIFVSYQVQTLMMNWNEWEATLNQ